MRTERQGEGSDHDRHVEGNRVGNMEGGGEGGQHSLQDAAPASTKPALVERVMR